MECIGGGGLESTHCNLTNAHDENAARVVHREITVGHIPTTFKILKATAMASLAQLCNY